MNQIPIVSQLLDVICRTTGMGFAAIARVTEDHWVTCTTKDDIDFGLKPGDELELETTICNEVRKNNDPVFIDHVAKDDIYKIHPTPLKYGFQSYISVPIVKKDGSFFGTLCAIDLKPAKVETPEVRGMFKLFSDLISFHLSAIEEMNTTKNKLSEELNNTELREQFIAILGHDLLNPVATTRMSADILIHTATDERVEKQARMIKATSFRMEGIIENILDFARGHLGDGIIIKKEEHLETLEEELTQIISEFKIIAPHKEIELNLDLAEPVNCDANRIGQLFSNLLSNADTHGAYDQPVKVHASSSPKEFQLTVINHGAPIPPESREHLFKPFYKNSTNPGKQGLGLGLFIASEIAKAHEGEITYESTPEETRFTFTISNL